MSNVVNLNRFRKKKKRAEDEQRANGNREKFGRTKAEKTREKLENQKTAKDLDASRLENDDESY